MYKSEIIRQMLNILYYVDVNETHNNNFQHYYIKKHTRILCARISYGLFCCCYEIRYFYYLFVRMVKVFCVSYSIFRIKSFIIIILKTLCVLFFSTYCCDVFLRWFCDFKISVHTFSVYIPSSSSTYNIILL